MSLEGASTRAPSTPISHYHRHRDYPVRVLSRVLEQMLRPSFLCLRSVGPNICVMFELRANAQMRVRVHGERVTLMFSAQTHISMQQKIANLGQKQRK